jgi:O-acetyl-ADP-ribose deacetylase (regulator of RNase III)
MIHYLKGDATQPVGKGVKIIAHICNDIGAWGAGFVLALSKRWLQPELSYRRIRQADRKLGVVQLVNVGGDPDGNTIYVANMIAQHNVRPEIVDGNPVPPIRYDALAECLRKVNNEAIRLDASIHAPKFGAGLGGGDWDIIEKIIKETITVNITIYYLNENDLPKKNI